MAAPAYGDFTIYTGTKLTNTDWNTNLQIIIDYLTDGTSDFTIGTLTCTDITGVGDVDITGDLAISGTFTFGTLAPSSLAVDGFSALGTGNTAIKLKTIQLVTGTGGGAVGSAAHGLTYTDIISVTGFIPVTGTLIPIGTSNLSYQTYVTVDATNVNITNGASIGTDINGKTATITIIYKSS